MKLIIGLGNPGKKFKNTRHNAGESAINVWAKKNETPLRENKKFKSFIAKTFFNDQNIILAFPQTFMNNSGIAAAQIAKFYKIPEEDIWVVHDDIDLALGKIKISKDKNAGGHNGVQSIIDHLKTKNFIRFRIGIDNGEKSQKNAENFVLEKFGNEEKTILNEAIKKTCQAIEMALTAGLNKAMSEFN